MRSRGRILDAFYIEFFDRLGVVIDLSKRQLLAKFVALPAVTGRRLGHLPCRRPQQHPQPKTALFFLACVPAIALLSALPSRDTCRSLEENRLAQLIFIIGHHALTPVDPSLVDIAINQPGLKPVVEKSRSVGNERLDSLDPSGT